MCQVAVAVAVSYNPGNLVKRTCVRTVNSLNSIPD